MSTWIGVAISLVMLWCIVGWTVYRSRCGDASAAGRDAGLPEATRDAASDQ